MSVRTLSPYTALNVPLANAEAAFTRDCVGVGAATTPLILSSHRQKPTPLFERRFLICPTSDGAHDGRRIASARNGTHGVPSRVRPGACDRAQPARLPVGRPSGVLLAHGLRAHRRRQDAHPVGPRQARERRARVRSYYRGRGGPGCAARRRHVDAARLLLARIAQVRLVRCLQARARWCAAERRPEDRSAPARRRLRRGDRQPRALSA
mmetsp:Transcript_4474/g.13800  ORF Transcript_4474/g.13800 Transcript_4474/m.13800 type:complete len:209 (+) Transcript_4474:192-818(+)